MRNEEFLKQDKHVLPYIQPTYGAEFAKGGVRAMGDGFGFGDLIKVLRYVVGFLKDVFALIDGYADGRKKKLEAKKDSNE